MKKHTTIYLLLFVAFSFSFISCGGDDDDSKGVTKEDADKILTSYITPEVEKVLTSFNFPLHEGVTPPSIEGTFHVDELKVIKSNVSSYDSHVNRVIGTQECKFYNQNSQKLTVDAKTLLTYTWSAYKGRTEDSNGPGAFICGSGNKFSVMFHMMTENKTAAGLTYPSKILEIYSGEVQKNADGEVDGIKDFYKLIIIVDDYGDPYDELIPVNTGRMSMAVSGASRID